MASLNNQERKFTTDNFAARKKAKTESGIDLLSLLTRRVPTPEAAAIVADYFNLTELLAIIPPEKAVDVVITFLRTLSPEHQAVIARSLQDLGAVENANTSVADNAVATNRLETVNQGVLLLADGNITFDTFNRVAVFGKTTISFTPDEAEAFCFYYRKKVTVAKIEAYRAFYGYTSSVDINLVEVRVCRLREKFIILNQEYLFQNKDYAGMLPFITTYRGVGYRFEEITIAQFKKILAKSKK